MMIGEHIKIAGATLRSAKWRSILTMLGVIIGIVAVITTLSLGEGLKRQVSDQINHLGADIVTVRAGKVVTRDSQGVITGVSLFSLAAGSLNEADIKLISSAPNVKAAAPYGLLTATAETEERKFAGGAVISTTESLPEVINQKVEYGTFFSLGDANKHVAVIGKRVAEELFRENIPTGRTFTMRGQEFIVRGVLEEFDSSPLQPGINLNTAIFIPFNIGKELSGGNLQIYQILAKPDDPANAKRLAAGLQASLKESHGGQENFTVLSQQENLAIAGRILDLITRVVAAIAGISLLVGGIGIMNIMLVSVSERTREIGIRKAVGATNGQILIQFLVEAVVLSFMGGVLGIGVSLVINLITRIMTNFEPTISIPAAAATAIISVFIGVVFGLAPAYKAARKDPIEALRYE